MENEELIRQQMENTRSSITEKLETLEEKVSDDIQAATGSVADTVKAVQDTVSSVKETVEGGAEAVKEVVQESVQTVKQWFDVKSQVQDHPWLVVAGAAGVGFCLGSILGRASISAPQALVGNGHGRTHQDGHGVSQGKRRSEKTPSWLSEFAPQISQLKGLAVSALLGSVRDMVMRSVPQQTGSVIEEIIDSVSQKLGGKKVSESDRRDSPFATTKKGDENDERDQFDRAKMGRSMGPASG